MLKEEHYKEAGIHFELAANFYKKKLINTIL